MIVAIPLDSVGIHSALVGLDQNLSDNLKKKNKSAIKNSSNRNKGKVNSPRFHFFAIKKNKSGTK